MASLSFRNRLIIILYIISFTASIVIFAFVMSRVAVNVDYTSYRQYAVENEKVYFIQNNNGRGYVFAMNSRGKVVDMFNSSSLSDSRILAVSTQEGKVYLVMETFVDRVTPGTEEIVTVPGFRVVCLDDDLIALSQTNKFTVEDGIVLSGFSAEDTGLYLTFITSDGSTIKVYNIPREELREFSDITKDAVKLEGVRTKKAGSDRFFAEALYAQGELIVREDNDVPSGIFAPDPVLKQILSNMKLSIGQIFSIYALYIIWYIAVFAVWCIVLYLVVKVLADKNRSFYYIVIAEVVLFLVTAVAVFTVVAGYQNARELEHSRFAATSLLGLLDDAGLEEYVDYSDPSFYNTERYQEIRSAITKFVKREGNREIFYDVLVERLRDETVCASASGRNQQTLTDVYGSKLADIPLQIMKGNRFASVDFTVEGQKYRAIAAADSAYSADYALVGIINTSSIDASVVVDNRGAVFFFLLVFAIASALVVLVWFLHMRDLVVLEQALADTAIGNQIPDRPLTLGRDVKDMWDAVAEIHKRVEGMQYSKLRILEAYYRFAPKNIELVLEKNSIIEVHNADSRAFDGTIGSICVDIGEGKKVKRLDYLIEAIGEYVRNHEAMIIGKDCDMSNIQLLFSDKEKTTTRDVVDIHAKFFMDSAVVAFSMLLFYDDFEFGVVGNEEESAIYLYAQEKDLIKKMSQFVSKMDLGLVIADKVLLRENYEGHVRFIGYGGRDKNGELVGLYEVLDAHMEKERVDKISTLSTFEEALKLFYDRDFYLARNKFSDILKDTPGDRLARWYVFESERFLHESVENDTFKILHI